MSQASNHLWGEWRNNYDKRWSAVHSPSECAPHIWWGVWFLRLGIRLDLKCGFISAGVTNRKPQPVLLEGLKKKKKKHTVSSQPLFFTSQGHCIGQMWLAVHLPSCTHTSKDLCPHGVNHKLIPLRKSLGQADDYIRGAGLPSVTISAKCSALSLTHTRFVYMPIQALSSILLCVCVC